MGFDTVSDWDAFELAIQNLENVHGVFKDENERIDFLDKVNAVIEAEKDNSKKLDIANNVVNIVKSVALGGMREALKAIPGIGSILS